MKDIKKVLSVLLFCIGVCCMVTGFCCGKMSDDYKGSSVMFGYTSNGEVHINSSGTIGGNSEGVRKFKMYSQISYVLCIMFIGLGLIQMYEYRKEKNCLFKERLERL